MSTPPRETDSQESETDNSSTTASKRSSGGPREQSTAETESGSQHGENADGNPSELLDRTTPDHLKLAWSGTLLSAGIGIMTTSPVLLLVTTVFVGVVTLRHVAEPPEPELSIRRDLSTMDPDPGETIEVELTVENVGTETLPDCRLVDRAPAELEVSSGSPRQGAYLRPGQECTLSYELTAEPGLHTFEGVYTIVSDRSGTHEHTYEFEASTKLVCRYEPTRLQTPVLRELTTPYAGRLSTEKPGEGLEFHSVREYRNGDPLKRIDWNQYATTRELATLQFRTERSAAVVLIADVRKSAYVRTREDDPHAANRCIEAVSRLLVTLLDDDHRVGLSTLGPDFWIAPGTGTEHRNRILDSLVADSAFSPTPPTEVSPIRLRTIQLLIRMNETTQVLLCTPLLDNNVEIQIQMLESAGHEVAVVSPNPTRMEGHGDIVAGLERKQRISRIHSYGVPVVDWSLDEDLDLAITQTMGGSHNE